ncbi:MAG: hypothetical protein LDL07_00215 [Desulfarculus sp.]|nr:hypothetical protein [Desulfarculus sp.]
MSISSHSLVIPARFWLLGSRGYVHGTTVFELVLQAIAEAAKAWGLAERAPRVGQFKIAREIKHHGRIVVYLGNEGPDQSTDPVVSLQGNLGGQPVTAGLWEDETQEVAERRLDSMAALVGNLELAGDFSGRVTLTGVANPAQLVTGIIAANKAMHLATLGEVGGGVAVRWLYLQNLPAMAAPSTAQQVRLGVSLAHRMPRGPELFTVCEFSGNFAGVEFATKICFGCKPV